MGAIGGLLGLSGGANGSGYNIAPGVNSGQVQTAYGGAQNSLQSQQALLAALQAQNGLGNQSQVYNQLQGVANGTGPNPAQAALNQNTAQNIQAQAALMAGQRGAGANAGLIARQAAQQGAATQQNAIGQAATLQANQSLNALGAAGSLANQQAANQIGATTANTQAQQSEQQLLQNANSQYNNVSGQLANTTMQGQQGLIGGFLSGFGATSSIGGAAAAAATGGIVKKDQIGDNPKMMAEGGSMMPQAPTMPQSSLGQFLWNSSASVPAPEFGADPGATALMGGAQAAGKWANQVGSGIGSADTGPVASNATVPTSQDWAAYAGAPGTTLNDQNTSMMGGSAYSRGGSVGGKLKTGGKVPGKPEVAGNSYQNDKVKALLSPGELVVDRETMADDGPAGQAARFLAAVIAAKKKGRK